MLVARMLLVSLLIGRLGVGLTVEDHLLPGFEALENVEDVFVLGVVGLARAHKRAVLETVLLELPLVFLGHAESLQAALVLEFEAGLGGSVLDQAEHLDQELRVLDDAPVPADGLIADIGAAHLALVLNLDELDVRDEAEHLDHVPDYLVRGDRLDQLDLVVRLKVGHLVAHLPNDAEIGATEHQLDVNVDADGDLAHRVLHKQDHAPFKVGFQVDATTVLHKESDLTLVICALKVDMTGDQVGATTPGALLQPLVNLYIKLRKRQLIQERKFKFSHLQIA